MGDEIVNRDALIYVLAEENTLLREQLERCDALIRNSSMIPVLKPFQWLAMRMMTNIQDTIDKYLDLDIFLITLGFVSPHLTIAQIEIANMDIVLRIAKFYLDRISLNKDKKSKKYLRLEADYYRYSEKFRKEYQY